MQHVQQIEQVAADAADTADAAAYGSPYPYILFLVVVDTYIAICLSSSHLISSNLASPRSDLDSDSG